MARQDAEAIVVRLGSLKETSQAQLNGFKSRALRAQAPTQRDQYQTEWQLLDIATERLGALQSCVEDGRRCASVCYTVSHE